jgi:hypothetical protein
VTAASVPSFCGCDSPEASHGIGLALKCQFMTACPEENLDETSVLKTRSYQSGT